MYGLSALFCLLLEMRMSIAATVVLSVAVLTGMVCGEHERSEVCDDALEILNSIKSSPDNYQQLINAFYPMNQARPSDVIIAYFPTTQTHFLKSAHLGPIHGGHTRE